MRTLRVLVSSALILSILALALLNISQPAFSQSASLRADALVIINSNSGAAIHYTEWIKPYLDYYGIPYTEWDLATNPAVPDFASFAVIIIGHDELDYFSTYLTPTIQDQISLAVFQGTGLVNFDTFLATGDYQDYYYYIQDIFGFTYYPTDPETIVRLNPNPTLGSYISELQTPGATYTLRNTIPHLGLTPLGWRGLTGRYRPGPDVGGVCARPH